MNSELFFENKKDYTVEFNETAKPTVLNKNSVISLKIFLKYIHHHYLNLF